MHTRLLLCFLIVICLIGCGEKKSNTDMLVGVSMPTKAVQRWNQDGANLQKFLQEEGYSVDLQYADNQTEMQISQISSMIDKGIKIVIVTTIDGAELSDILETAKSKAVAIIAYDRLIMNTDVVSYYVAFDNYRVGQMQAEYIEQKLGLAEATRPFNIELVTGDTNDNNVKFYFAGAMEVLQPYIDSGKLVVQSGEKSIDEVSTERWDGRLAQLRFENILSKYYFSGERVDAVLCSNDILAAGVIRALNGVGYTPHDMPVITGQDCDIVNVKSIILGEQSVSIFKDTRILAEKAVEIVAAIANKKTVRVNDTTTYNNGVKTVPSYLLDPRIVDASNYKELLLDSGYYKLSDLQ